MYKELSLLVLVALATVVLAAETQDQATAEQFYSANGYYPSWYNAAYYTGVRSYGYPYGYAGAYPGYTGAYSGYTGAYPYGINAYTNAYRTYPAGYANGYNYLY